WKRKSGRKESERKAKVLLETDLKWAVVLLWSLMVALNREKPVDINKPMAKLQEQLPSGTGHLHMLLRPRSTGISYKKGVHPNNASKQLKLAINTRTNNVRREHFGCFGRRDVL
ncbi:hypothetical protein M513_14114, partial [Trichuris suis]